MTRHATTYRLLLAALAALAITPAAAHAHAGHPHPELELGEAPTRLVDRQVTADAQLAQRVEQQSERMAPDAVRDRCTKTVDVPEQGPSCVGDDGEWIVKLEDGEQVATHGGDPVLAGTVFGTIPTSSATDSALANAGPSSVSCTTNPRVPHYRLIYARPADAADRSGTLVPALRTETYKASAFIEQQAQLDSGSVTRKLRVWCSGGTPVVDVVQLSVTGANDDFTSIVSDLRGRGYSSPEPQVARYLVYYDGIVGPGTWGFGGQATTGSSSSPDPFSSTNEPNRYAIDYADADGTPIWYTLTHEAMHNMGAVQTDAPDTNGNGHCLDDHDVMCYDDGSGAPTIICAELELDCGSDSYFNAGAPFGYLASHWNAGQPMNRFIDHGSQNVDYTTPTAPTNPSQTGSTFTSATISWTASIDDVGVSAYRVQLSTSGSFGPWVTQSEAATTTRTVTGLLPGTTRYVRILALDAAGNIGAPVSLAVTTPVDTTAPAIPTGLTSSSHTQTSFRVTWNAATDNDQVAAYLLDRNVNGAWTTIATLDPNTTAYDVSGQAADTSFILAVRARDRSGNTSARSVSHTTSTLPDTTAPTTPTNVAVSGGTNSITASWAHSSDASGVAYYHVVVSGPAGVVTATTTTSNLVTFTVTGGHTYTVSIRAVDTGGNGSGYSAASGFASAPAPPPPATCPSGTIGTPPNCTIIQPPPPTSTIDTTKPTVPTRLRVTRTFRTAAVIAWNPSRDNVRMRGYRVYVLVGRTWKVYATVYSATARAYVIRRLRPGRSYRFAVAAFDTRNNTSARSAAVIVRTRR